MYNPPVVVVDSEHRATAQFTLNPDLPVSKSTGKSRVAYSGSTVIVFNGAPVRVQITCTAPLK